MYGSRIIGTGSYLPKRVMTNADWSKLVDTNDEWIKSRTGISERHFEEPGKGVADMAEDAARIAIESAGLTAGDIDLIVFATSTPDLRLPSSAVLLQRMLGAKNAFAFDLVAACAGSLYGLSVARQYAATGAKQNVLVVGAEMMTSIIDMEDRASAVLFGDAAAAAVVSRSDESRGFIDFELHADGEQWDALMINKGGSREPPSRDIDPLDYKLRMKGREVYKHAVRNLSSCAKSILAKHGYTVDDVKVVTAHQANMRIIEAISERLELPMERWVTNLERVGNTSAASLLLTIDDAVRQERMQKGDLVLMLAIGAGLTWGSALYRA